MNMFSYSIYEKLIFIDRFFLENWPNFTWFQRNSTVYSLYYSNDQRPTVSNLNEQIMYTCQGAYATAMDVGRILASWTSASTTSQVETPEAVSKDQMVQVSEEE
jgi:5-methylthioribose kinase